MGHRHLYSISQMFESEPDQNWNHMHTDQHYVQLGNLFFMSQLNLYSGSLALSYGKLLTCMNSVVLLLDLYCR